MESLESSPRIRIFTRLIVLELFEAIAERDGENWTLAISLGQLEKGTSFKSTDQLVDAVVVALVERFASRAGIRAA